MTQYQPRSIDVTTLKTKPILDEITVVIPTLGRSILRESLYWIINGGAWPGGLIVVDQGQNAEILSWMETIRELGVAAEYIPSTQRGRAAGINRGIERAQTRFIAVTDDDCFVESDWLENLDAHLKENPESIVTGRVEAGTDDVIVVVTSEIPSVQRRPKLSFDHMSGGNMGTSMTVVERVGLFDADPRLKTAEDGEFAYRALRAGVPIIYAPDVCVRHMGWRDEGQREVQYQEYAHSHGGFYGKYLRQGDWFIALRLVVHQVRALRRWVRGTLTGDVEAKAIGRAYFKGLLPGVVESFRKDKMR